MKEFNLTNPTGSHPADNGRLVVTKFSVASEQAAGGAPGTEGEKGVVRVVRVGCPRVGPRTGKPVAFLDPVTLAPQKGFPLKNGLSA